MTAADLADLIEERAAIIQEGEGISRTETENRAAQLHGFADWAAYLKSTEGKTP